MEKKYNILLIEDNPGDARLIQETLKEDNDKEFSFEHFDRISKALSNIIKNSYDIILLDLSLPDSKGTEGIGKIQEIKEETPIIILTGRDDKDLALNIIKKGAQDYLVKGQVDSNLLWRSIIYAIERKITEIELKKKIEEIESFNKIAIDRELKMIKLKERVMELETQLGIKE